jgi:hypothetical protein
MDRGILVILYYVKLPKYLYSQLIGSSLVEVQLEMILIQNKGKEGGVSLKNNKTKAFFDRAKREKSRVRERNRERER